MTITPTLAVNDPAAAAANARVIQAALDAAAPGQVVQLPAGTVHHTAGLKLLRSGAILAGASSDPSATVLQATPLATTYPWTANLCVGNWLDKCGYCDWFANAPKAGDTSFVLAADTWQPQTFQPGGVCHVFPWQDGSARMPSQAFRIRAVAGRLVSLNAPLSAALVAQPGGLRAKGYPTGRLVAGACPAGSDSCRLAVPGDVGLFPPQSRAFLTDGAGIVEAYGEWVQVRQVDARHGVVTFTRPLRRSYAAGACVLVGGPWTVNPTVRDLTIGPNPNAQGLALYAKWTAGLTLQNVVTTADNAGVNFGTTWLPGFWSCRLGQALILNSTQELLISGGEFANVGGEEWCLGAGIANSKLHSYGFGVGVEIQHSLLNVTFDAAHQIALRTYCTVQNCTDLNPPPGCERFVRGSHVRVSNLHSNADWWVQDAVTAAGYVDPPDTGPQDVRFTDCSFNTIRLGPGTTGTLTRCQGQVIDQSGGVWHFS